MSDRKVVGRLKSARGPIEIEWDIPHFLSLSAEVDESYVSPAFRFCGSSWYLELYPNGSRQLSSEGCIGVCLNRGESGPPVCLIYSLFLKKAGGRKKILDEEKDTFREKDHGWGESEAILRSELIKSESEFLPSGALTVICTLKSDEADALEGNENEEVARQTTACGNLPAAPSTSKVLRDLEKMLLSEDGCDVTLHVQGRKFEAHRTVLRARSSVLASMLSTDMKEKSTGLIDIEDCDPDAFPDFLRFLYCGSADSVTSQNACSLYRVADKYDVQDLKSECLAFVKSHLDVDNFCDVIAVALKHDESDLLKQATDFFAENMLKIVLTVKWQTFLAENPAQGNELIVKGLSAQKRSSQ